jgi:hypothetical protein
MCDVLVLIGSIIATVVDICRVCKINPAFSYGEI